MIRESVTVTDVQSSHHSYKFAMIISSLVCECVCEFYPNIPNIEFLFSYVYLSNA